MADKYTLANYTRAALPRTYGEDIRTLVDVAVHLGWTLYVARNQNCQLVSYNGAKQIPLNPRQRSKPVASLRETVHRHANPLLAADQKKVNERVKQIEATVNARTNTEVVHALGAKDFTEAKHKVEEIIEENGSVENMPTSLRVRCRLTGSVTSTRTPRLRDLTRVR
jgi:hypothetical protein